jgi:hypothetical protein
MMEIVSKDPIEGFPLKSGALGEKVTIDSFGAKRARERPLHLGGTRSARVFRRLEACTTMLAVSTRPPLLNSLTD